MEVNLAHAVRLTKHLRSAIGYHELGMTQHALQCLDQAQLIGDIGPWRLAIDMVRGEVLHSAHRYEAAAEALEHAARLTPAPYNQAIWLALSACYREAGDTQRAVDTLACARGVKPPETPFHAPHQPGA